MLGPLLLALTAQTLPASTVEAELRLVEETLDAAYPRALMTEDAWRSARKRLRSVREHEAMTAARFCEVLGSAVARVHDVRVFMPDGKAACLDYELGIPAHAVERPAADAGPNSAGDRRFGLETVRRGRDTVAVLGVSAFEPPGPAWAGFDEAVKSTLQADALILDLRGARGRDPRAALPLLRALTGLKALPLLKAIDRSDAPEVEALRRPFAAGHRDRAVWRGLVGALPPAPKAPRRPAHVATVLIGPGCAEACQLVARTLERYAHIGVIGELPRFGPSLVAGERAQVVLPRTKLRVELPTAAYVLAEGLARYPSMSKWWRHGRGTTKDRDVLEPAIDNLLSTLERYRRIDRWKDRDPPACATLPTVEDWRSLPPAARKRTSSGWPSPRVVTVWLHLPLERARAYVAGCPGVTVSGGGYEVNETAHLTVHAARWSDVARLAHSEALVGISIEHDLPHEPD